VLETSADKKYVVRVFLNRANGPWSEQLSDTGVDARASRINALFGSGKPLTFGDFNADGVTDIVLTASPVGASAPSSIALLLGDGTGKVGEARALNVGDGCTSTLVSGDWDADGLADLALLDAHATQLQLAFGDGSGGFSSAVTSDVPQRPQQNDEASDDDCPGIRYAAAGMHVGHYTGAREQDIEAAGTIFMSQQRSAPLARVLRKISFHDSGYPNDDPNGDLNGDGYTDVADALSTIELINATD
jgi:hypothetical protein